LTYLEIAGGERMQTSVLDTVGKITVLFYKSTQLTCTLNKTSLLVTLTITPIRISCRSYLGLAANSYGSVCSAHLSRRFLVYCLCLFCA